MTARYTPQRGEVMAWFYDQAGTMLGFELNGVPYFYVRNLQGDVVKVVNAGGEVVAWYTYDSWGNILEYGGELARVNPITYRGYYWDAELGLFYLQSRYYDPMLRRFVSADALLDTSQGVLGTNMYIYCLNDPINMIDPDGYTAFAPNGHRQVLTSMGIPSRSNNIGQEIDMLIAAANRGARLFASDNDIVLAADDLGRTRVRIEWTDLRGSENNLVMFGTAQFHDEHGDLWELDFVVGRGSTMYRVLTSIQRLAQGANTSFNILSLGFNWVGANTKGWIGGLISGANNVGGVANASIGFPGSRDNWIISALQRSLSGLPNDTPFLIFQVLDVRRISA